MRLFYLALWCWVIALVPALAQTVVFSKLPASWQLYPRNAQSVAAVPVAGRVIQPGYNRVTMHVHRNATLYQTHRHLLTYANGTAPFSLTATIPAELAPYRVRIYLHLSGSTDSVLVADRQQIVAGDVYIIEGQSNASAYVPPPRYTYQNPYLRTFGVYADDSNFAPYNPADTLWTTCGLDQATSAGGWGMELGRQIVEQYGIPVCILNGAAGGAGVEYLNIRYANDPMNLNTNHGRLLYRVVKGGLQGKIKAYFYRQGETETSGNAPAWPTEFEKLYQNVMLDFPEISRFYLFQIHLLNGFTDATAVFRDYQRRLGSIHSNVQTHATVGTTGYDGIHYNAAGYAQTGAEIFRIVARDFYGSTDTNQITSPNVQKVYYRTATQNELVVQFDEGQQLIWPNDTTVADAYGTPITLQLRQWLWLDRQAGAVVSGRAEGDRLILTLNGNQSAQKIAYLPPNYPQLDGQGYPLPGYARAFPGPFIKNRRGLGAFSFWEVPINSAIAPLNGFAATAVSTTAIQLWWSDHPTEQTYVLERKRPFDAAFTRLAELPAGTTAYTDQSLTYAVTYQYRLRAVTPTAEATAEASATIACLTGNELISMQTGPFDYGGTWNCGRVPTVADRVRINALHVVTLNRPIAVKGIALYGKLRFDTGGRLQITP